MTTSPDRWRKAAHHSAGSHLSLSLQGARRTYIFGDLVVSQRNEAGMPQMIDLRFILHLFETRKSLTLRGPQTTPSPEEGRSPEPVCGSQTGFFFSRIACSATPAHCAATARIRSTFHCALIVASCGSHIARLTTQLPVMPDGSREFIPAQDPCSEF